MKKRLVLEKFKQVIQLAKDAAAFLAGKGKDGLPEISDFWQRKKYPTEICQ